MPVSELQLPPLPHPVMLTMPTGERMPGRITQHSGTELEVLMLYEIQRPLNNVQLSQIVLEIDDGESRTRLCGSATRAGDTLRFEEVRVAQRREHVRVSASLPVEAKLAGSAAPLQCQSIDLSGGGVLLRGIEHKSTGDRLAFSISIGEGVPEISGTGTIVRCDAGGGRAVSFDSITETDQERLIHFLFQRQREARHRGLIT